MGTSGTEFKGKKKNAVHVGGGESLELFNVYRTSVWDDGRVLEVERSGGCTNVTGLNVINDTLKND